MTELEFDDIDPDFTLPETGDGADDETIARAVRRLRFERLELAALDRRFETELARVDAAWGRARGPIHNRIESLQAMLSGWFRWRQTQAAAAGRKPAKSEAFPDGRIQSRVSHRVEVDAGASTPFGFPEAFRRTKVEVDRKAVADAVRAGDLRVAAGGVLVDVNGEVLPGRWVEDVSITIKTDEGADDE